MNRNFSKKLAFSSLIILVCLCLGLVACTSVFNKKDVYIDDETDDSPLKVYLMYWDRFAYTAIGRYNWQVKAELIDSREVEITAFAIDKYEEMYDRIKNEILAGEGPDIILIDDSFCYNNDFAKMAEQNAFADLDILIDNNETFSFDKCNKDIMDAGIISGKRVLMPVLFDVEYIVATQENAQTMGLSANDSLEFNTLLDIIEKNQLNSDGTVVSNMLQSYFERNYLDNEGQLLEHVSQKQLELFKEESLRIINNVYPAKLDKIIDIVCKGEMLTFSTVGTSSNANEFELLSLTYNDFADDHGKSIHLYNQPHYDDKSYGVIKLGFAVNINSKHKNDAFKFLEYMIGKPIQSETDDGVTLPVNEEAYEIIKQKLIDNRYYQIRQSRIENTITPVPEEIINKYIQIVEGVDGYQFLGRQQYITSNIINEQLEDFHNDKIDYDTMMQQVESKLELYLSE